MLCPARILCRWAAQQGPSKKWNCSPRLPTRDRVTAARIARHWRTLDLTGGRGGSCQLVGLERTEQELPGPKTQSSQKGRSPLCVLSMRIRSLKAIPRRAGSSSSKKAPAGNMTAEQKKSAMLRSRLSGEFLLPRYFFWTQLK